jgi:hypothetical protein
MNALNKKLSEIQKKLKAPKGQKNSFGGYKYRSCEDILEAVKPLLGDCTIVITDEVVDVAGRVYVKSTATISDGENYISTNSYAREADHKKGMDESQVTGSTSSYARKYALNGLLLIDDTKDADTIEGKSQIEENEEYLEAQLKLLRESKTLSMLQGVYTSAYKKLVNDKHAVRLLTEAKDEMKARLDQVRAA